MQPTSGNTLPMSTPGQSHQWVEALRAKEGLPAYFTEIVKEVVAPLAVRIQSLRREKNRPLIVGINGAQGSGKSTLALFLQYWLERELETSAARLSLDDLYLGRTEREIMAREIHPLFATRGVPGTHDLDLGHRVLNALTDTTRAGTVSIPQFDKASDDRSAETDWPTVNTPVGAVLLEGWCVGARPQAAQALETPVNALEAADDPDATWRREVNRQLQSAYAEFFQRIDALVMLRVPSFAKVIEWRRLQEEKLRARAGGDGASGPGQTDEELDRFIRHYERLTRHMLATMPAYADTLIDIDNKHRIVSVTHRGKL